MNDMDFYLKVFRNIEAVRELTVRIERLEALLRIKTEDIPEVSDGE